MCKLSFESIAIELYFPTSPELSMIILDHDDGVPQEEAQEEYMRFLIPVPPGLR